MEKLTRYRVVFEFVSGNEVDNPAEWHWGNLLESIEDNFTTVDLDTVSVYKQSWELVGNDD